jgi:hypothetical protein
MDEVYARLTPAMRTNTVLVGNRQTHPYKAVADSLRASGAFIDVDMASFAHEIDYSTAEWLELASTHSDHHTLPGEARTALLEALGSALDAAGGRVPVRYETTLVTGRAAGR